MEELDRIAQKLCALSPAEFTAARDARAAAASDPALAKAIKGLRKPVVAAWAVDLLAAHGELGEALALSQALREAQDDLDAGELARLGGQRRALVAALARQATALASDAGVTLSAAARDAVEKTVNAAVMDAAAAAAALTGRLVRPLEAAGFGDAAVDLDGAVAGTPPAVTPAAPSDELAERRERRAAERAARDAERAAGDALRELERVGAQRDRARERAAHLADRIAQLRAELSRLEADAVAAEADAERLDAVRSEAAAAAKTAAAAATHAAQALESTEG